MSENESAITEGSTAAETPTEGATEDISYHAVRRMESLPRFGKCRAAST
jgi:hypothetical protein